MPPLELPEGFIVEAWKASARTLPKRRNPSGTYSVRCVFPESHKNGDRSPSAYLDPERNIFGCSCLGEPLTAKAFCAQTDVDFVRLCRAHGLIPDNDAPTPRPESSRASTPAQAPVPTLPEFTPDDAAMLFSLALDRRAAKDPADTDAREYLGNRGLLSALDPDGGGEPLVGLVPPACDAAESEAVRKAVRVLGRDGGFRIVAPLYAADGGAVVAIQGRFVGDAPPDDWRHGARTWTNGPVRGALLANAGGRALLSGATDAPKRAILCEGLTDFLAVSLHAPKGTAVFGIPGAGLIEAALTRDVPGGRGTTKPELHAWVRACDVVVLAVDADDEGKKAAEKALAIFEALGKDGPRIRVATWPDGSKDACSVLHAHGADALAQCIANAKRASGPEPVRYLDLATLARDGIPPMNWLLVGWIAERDEVLVVATAGAGKSTTGGSLAVALASGASEWCGLKITRPIRVLVLDEEQGEVETARMFIRLGGHLGLALQNLRVASGTGITLGSEEGIARFEEEIREFRPELVLLDSATTIFAVQDENNSAQVAGVYRELHRLRDAYGVGFLVIHHRRKSAPGGGDASIERVELARGSSSFGTQSSCVILATTGSEADTLDLRMAKRRGGEKASLRTRYASDGPEGAITITGGSIRTAENDKATDFVIEFLAPRDSARAKDIEIAAVGAGVTRATVRRAMGRLKRDGILETPRRGEWRLASGPPTPDAPIDETIPIAMPLEATE
ncbi:MAG: AAA family ATPase [bacterium]